MKKKMKTLVEDSSFRDPSGNVFYKGNKVYRQVNYSYKENLDLLFNSGLYDQLTNNDLLLKHQNSKISELKSKNIYKFLETTKIPFISYPYEWSFSQLKDAALVTLTIQKTALKYSMSLKDASAYNIQFFQGKPIFIDLLSFEKYRKNEPWVAYQQFCKHFLSPLLLESYVNLNLNKLLQIYIDGIPLEITSNLLPKKTFLSFPILSHIHLHSKKQNDLGNKNLNKKGVATLKKDSLYAIIDNLFSLIKNLRPKNTNTEWGEYYSFTNYSKKSLKNKAEVVSKYIETIKPKEVWDVGANNGFFSQLASNKNIYTISMDIDPIAVEKNYLDSKKKKNRKMLPLVIDFTNPSPPIGWENKERKSIIQRGPADMVMALALIHHLAISNNLPFEKIVDFFHQISTHLIIEFVPKNDSKVQTLLKTREDIFQNYDQPNFEKEFSKKFKIIKKEKISGSLRTCYLMKSK